MGKSLVQRWLQRRLPGFDDPNDLDKRAKIGMLEGWVSIVSNTILMLVKGWLGLVSGSLSLLADAFHTFTDSFTSVVVLIGFRVARKPADTNHPFGHGRMESIASLVIGVLLGVASIEIGRAAFDRITDQSSVEAPLWLIIIVGLTALFKELLARFSFELGKLIKSDTLTADGWHHRSDMLSTLMVIVAMLGARIDLFWLDGVAGIGVALLIAWAAWRIVKSAAAPLLGEPISDENLAKVIEIAKGVEGVLGVHEIVMQSFGMKSVLSLHVEMEREKTLVQAHNLSQEVERCLSDALNAHVTVHVDPQGAFHEETEEIRAIVSHEVAQIESCSGFHDLRIERKRSGDLRVLLDITSKSEPTEIGRKDCQMRLQSVIRRRFPHTEVVVEMDPPFCAFDPEMS